MQNIIAMEVLSAVSENGFSLDELVFKTKELFEEEGLAGFVALVLRLVDERICLELTDGKFPKNLCTCCSKPRYYYLDRIYRRQGQIAMEETSLSKLWSHDNTLA